MKMSKKESLALSILYQQQWISDHGLSHAGYVKRYSLLHYFPTTATNVSSIFSSDIARLAVLIGLERKANGRKGEKLQREDVYDAILFTTITLPKPKRKRRTPDR